MRWRQKEVGKDGDEGDDEDDDEGVNEDGGEGDDEDHCEGEKGNDFGFQVNIESPLLGHQESRPSAVFRGRSPVE